jgi:hypothetical protein
MKNDAFVWPVAKLENAFVRILRSQLGIRKPAKFKK